jgi:hypothetical protein
VARGSTWLQEARGENHRPQDGARGLVDDAQPTDLSAVSQGDPFRGIDLPGLVRPRGLLRRRAGSPGRRRRPQPGGAEPTAERAGAGPGDLGPSHAEGDPDQDRPPGGVLPPQGQCGLAHARAIGTSQVLGRAIIRRDALGSAVAESFLQMSHGAGGEAESGREAGGRLALLGALEQLPPHGDGHGLWHQWVLRARVSRG